MPVVLEICVDSIESSLAAFHGGANRLELCSALSEGGLTPTVGMLELVKCHTTSLRSDFKIYPMIRPRRGDFLYTELEIASMVKDIYALKQAGADGFVFGCLTAEGNLDLKANEELLKAADPLPCTLHRAIDVCRDIHQALTQAVALGFTRVLTSGQAPTALQGVEKIRELQQSFGNRLTIMAGAGVTADNAAELLQQTGVQEIHSSASIVVKSDMKYQHAACTMGGRSAQTLDEYTRRVASSEAVKRLVEAICRRA